MINLTQKSEQQEEPSSKVTKRITPMHINLAEKHSNLRAGAEEVKNDGEETFLNNDRNQRRDAIQNIGDEDHGRQGIASFRDKWNFRPSTRAIIISFSQSTKVRWLLICLMLILVYGSFSILVSTAVYYGNNSLLAMPISNATDYIAYNLNADPIMQITPANLNSACPDGLEQLQLGQWPGVFKSCYCNYPKHHYTHYGRCFGEGKCSNVHAISGFNIYDWDDSLWCISRAKLGVDYNKSSICSNGFKKCSDGICVRNSLDCPITSVNITSVPLNSGSQLLGDQRYLTVSREVGEAPLIDIKTTLNDISCFDSTAEQYSSQTAYGPLKTVPQGCGRYGVDNLFSFQIDSQNYGDLLRANNPPQSVFTLPDYKTLTNATTVYLTGRRRITTKNDDRCLSLDPKITGILGPSIEDLDNNFMLLVIFALIFQGMFVLANTVFVIASLCNPNRIGSRFRQLTTKSWAYWLNGFFMVPLAFMLAGGALLFNISGHVNYSGEYLLKLQENNCFSEVQPLSVLNDLHSIINHFIPHLTWYGIGIYLSSLLPYCLLVALYKMKTITM